MDPVTIATLISKFGPVAAQFFGARKNLKEIGSQAAQDERDATRRENELRANMPQLSVSGAWDKYLQMSRQDAAADLLRQQQQRSEAGNVSALKAGGARALIGGLGAVSAQGAQQRAQIEADAQQRQLAAQSTYAGVAQNVSDVNQQNARALAIADLNRAIRQKETSRETRRESELQRRQNVTDLAAFGLSQFGQGHLQGLDMNFFKNLRKPSRKSGDYINPNGTMSNPSDPSINSGLGFDNFV